MSNISWLGIFSVAALAWCLAVSYVVDPQVFDHQPSEPISTEV